MSNKKITEYTLSEFRSMENFGQDAEFTSLVIVPMDELHDSGFRAMKFILCRDMEIVGVVGGWSDVVHIDGIGGYGLNWNESLKTGMKKVVGWSIDCLPTSGCLRLFCGRGTQCKLPPFVGSDLEVFVEEK